MVSEMKDAAAAGEVEQLEGKLRTDMPSTSEESGNTNFIMRGGHKLDSSSACNFFLRIYRSLAQY
jgi:hypothetical protein